MNQRLHRLLGTGFRRPAMVLGAVIVAAALVGAPASAASASTGTSSKASAVQPAATDSWGCTVGWFCFWVDAGPAGPAPGKVQGANPDWRVFSQPFCRGGNWNDCASALDNQTSHRMWVHEDINYSGGERCLSAGARLSNLTGDFFNNGHNMNDAISADSTGVATPCT